MAQQNMKQKVFSLITKLGDRDTYSMAAKELESMARDIDPAAGNLQQFISGILSVDAADKPAVRKHCLHLISVLSLSLPSNALSPYLSKILTRLTRRLRDPDSSIRSACVAAVSGLASRTSKPPFASAFLKPLADAVFTEQEVNAQIGAALCLAAAIDAAPEPDPVRLGRSLLPRMEKLVKCEGFKAKAAGLVVIGSVIGAGGALGGGGGGLKGLVDCLVGFLSSEDWAARKAAAEALGRLAVAERDSLAECKSGCLKVFESRKFDKVKAVREVMNQMMEVWKQVPDISDEVSPPRSNASSKEDASDGRYPAGSKVSSTPSLDVTKMRRRASLDNRSTPPHTAVATAARPRNSHLKSSEKKLNPVSNRKPNCRRGLDWKVGSSVTNAAPLNEKTENVPRKNNENAKVSGQETSQTLLGQTSGDKIQKFSERTSQFTSSGGIVSENQNCNHKGFEDLPLIRNQLVQIEQQQSSLMDLLQRFIGSSQNGMRALETRVHGLELAVDEISYDLAVSSGRITSGSRGSSCCLLPTTDFLRSKFWRKIDGRCPNPRLRTSEGNPSVQAMHFRANRNGDLETFGVQNTRLRLHGGGGFIVNPLAEIPGDSLVSNGSTGILPMT